jgi:RNA polymerase sigma-70 factor (ECF subfamily)
MWRFMGEWEAGDLPLDAGIGLGRTAFQRGRATSGAEQLVRRCTEGDARAWREFVERFRVPIVRILVRGAWVTDPDEVRDLEQEVWTRLLHRDREALRRLRSQTEDSIRAFLYTVALNVARDARRRAGARADREAADEDDLDELTDGADPEAQVADRERHLQALEAARAEVADERDLLIFRLYYLDGASASEIAAVPGIGLTPKGVETVIHRLTKRVRVRLGNDA